MPAQAVCPQRPGLLAHSWHRRTMMSMPAGPGAWAARVLPGQAMESHKSSWIPLAMVV